MYSVAELSHKTGQTIWPYIQIARLDHWIKNAFMLLGVLLVFFYEPALLSWASIPLLTLAFFSTCLVASSNYVLNEFLDGPTDRFHPDKKSRPVPSGKVRAKYALLEWIVLGGAGILIAVMINRTFGISALILWVMGIAYNVPPFRLKELPYLDVLAESFNNPLRLFLGWFSIIPTRVPPLSLVLAFWMVGAFFMATKRFAEYRHIGDEIGAAKYRKSFGYYTEDRLLVSMFFYAIVSALFTGIFIIRYRVELILLVPFTGGLFAYYLRLGLRYNSPAQHPERLIRERGFLLYLTLSVAVFILLMLIHIPFLYDWFNVEPAGIQPLWTIGTATEKV